MAEAALVNSILFSPLTLRGTTFQNRVVISPMCTYSAEDGIANDWHLAHLGQFALGAAAAVFTEAALKLVTAFIARHGALPEIQLAYAGRKASMQRPWHGNGPMDSGDEARGEIPWEIVGPSAEAMREGWLVLSELSVSEIHAIQDRFTTAAGHALDVGFQVLEIHSAHGYLGHSFLSPTSNQRNDAYGGDRAERMRFTLEIAEKVRSVWPDDRPLFVRISLVDSDGVTEGWQLDDLVALAGELKSHGVDVIDCSSSGISGCRDRGPGKTAPRISHGLFVPDRR